MRTAVVCDDDTLTRNVLARLLEVAGYEVLAELGTAVDALEVTRLSKPDLLVLDLSLPGMSGVAVIPEVRTASPLTQVIVCTAFDRLADEVPAHGVHAVISKSELMSLGHLLDGLVSRPA